MMKQKLYWVMGDGKKQSVFPHQTEYGVNVFEFPDLIIKSFNMLGDYECVIESKLIIGGKIVSKKISSSKFQGALSYDRAMLFFLIILF